MATNIWLAASEGNLAVVQSLLEADESLTPTSPDHNTYTPLHAAASYGHIELLRFLLSHPRAGPNAANVTDEDGDTPLFVVEDVQTAKVLVEEFKADPRIKNQEGITAAKSIFENGWEEAAEFVRSHTGEPPFEQEEDGEQQGSEDEPEEKNSGVGEDDEKHDGEYTKALVAKLQQYGTCEISDALIKLSHPTGGHLPGVDLVSPHTTSLAALTSHKICGQVFPVQMVSTSDQSAPPKPAVHFVDAAPKDSIMLVSAPSNTRSAIWGGLMTARAQAKGVKGVVLDGRCRDLGEHWAAGMTIFSRGHSTLGQSPFTRPARIGERLVISTPPTSMEVAAEAGRNPAFPDLVVDPADLILADVDGVVIVPRRLVEEAVRLAEEGRRIDERCMQDLKQGRGVEQTFKAHRGK